MTFDKREYDRQYKKEQTKLITLRVKNDVAMNIDAYCKFKGESKQGLLLRLINESMQHDHWVDQGIDDKDNQGK